MPGDTDRLNLLIGLRRYAEAEKAAREAIGRDPTWAAAYTHLARALINLNRADEAIEAAREGARKAPKDAWAVGTLACALNWFDRPKAALAPAQEAVRIDPTYPWAYAMLANVLFNLNRYKDARQTASDGMRHDPTGESLFRWKGWAEHSLKRYADALATAEAGVAHHPASPPLLNLLGRVKWSLAEQARGAKRQDLHRAAETALAEAVRLDPTQPGYRTNRRDNAVSARRAVLRPILSAVAIVCVLVPTGVFGLVGTLLTGNDLYWVPVMLAGVVVFVASLADFNSATILCAPLGRFRPPSPPPEPVDYKIACGEMIAYGLFLLAPYGVMAFVVGKTAF